MTTPSSDFDIAKTITESLEKLERGRQELILRWVRESLHLDPVALRPVPAAPAVLGSDTTSSPAEPGTSRVVDIKTFVEEKRPKSDMQFGAVVAYYYRFVAPPAERREMINADVLQEAARLSGRARPPKPYMTLTNAKNQGYLDALGQGEFKLNTVGENLVAMTLPGGTAGQGAGSARRGKRTGKTRSGKKKRQARQ